MVCCFVCDDEPVGPFEVLDVGCTGFAASVPPELALPPGTVLEGANVLLGGRIVWSGTATVVPGGRGRIGARFETGLIDLNQLHLELTLEVRLLTLREQQSLLPASWRAAISDVRKLLEDARFEVEAFEKAGYDDPLRRVDAEAELFGRLRMQWGMEFYGALEALHEQSRLLDGRARALGRSYAKSALMPLLYACPLHRRVYEKPLGYAGDYRMMELFFAHERTGDGLFGRFLHSIAQGYTLGKSVTARELVMREAVVRVISHKLEQPARILSLACGPAVELRRLLESPTRFERPIEILLLDQDQGALETAHSRLSRLIVERPRHEESWPVTITCLHFSVRQLLKPQSSEERAVVDTIINELDLIYSAGLFDYLPDPIATRLTTLLYSRLRQGGRLLVGNLMEASDTTWLMEFVLDWMLLYRTDAMMINLAADLFPAPSDVGITRDATGHCIFLDIKKGRL
jgi:extracellular factor (EF) 3-hydroxypalmitic acid methyl ester biosynthesis protein